MASTADNLNRRQRYEQLRAALLLERATFEPHWRELGDFLLPRRTRFFVSDRNKGDRRNQNIIDATPRHAARTLQSGLHAGLTSPARPWMRLTTPDPDLSEHAPVKEWLHTVTRRMLTVFQRGNLYNVLPTLYGDLGVFGTAAMSVLADGHDLMRCYSYPLGSFAIGVDGRGLATTFIHERQLTVRQLVEQFGGADGAELEPGQAIDWTRFSRSARKAWDAGNYEQVVDVTWVVTPNDLYDARRPFSKFLRWSSCHFENGREAGGGFLRESGFNTFPFMVPRWDVTGDDSYGTDCPGMVALGDVKALQVMHRRKAQAVDKALNPPLVGPAALRTQKTSLLPGDITYQDVRDGMQGLRPIHEVRLEGVQHLALDIQQTQQRVERTFYADLFLMMAMSDRSGQPITAREIDERHEEKLLALGPVLERTNDELLDPLVDRTFSIMQDAGAIPMPPKELEGVDLKVEYTSLMSQAQKLVGVVGQDRFLQSVGSLVGVFPEVRHKVQIFQAIDDYGDMLGVNPKLLRSNEDAQASLEAEQQAIAAANQAKQLRDLGGAAQALGNTPMGGDTALQAVLDGTAA
jgi:hypothetical protein